MVENISQKYYVKLNTICNVRINTIKWDVPSPRMNENEVGDKANELTNPIFIPIKEYNVTYSQSQKRRFLDLISIMVSRSLTKSDIRIRPMLSENIQDGS